MEPLKAPCLSKRPREEDVDSLDDTDNDDDGPQTYKWDCSQIRTKINALIRSGEMKVTEFQRTNGINSNSYGRFMKLKGPYGGSDNQTYHAGHPFFLKRERKGLKMPKAKKAKAEDLAKYDVSGINLPGEDEDDAPIYDTCDDMRAKIQAHIRNPGVTQASLLREISKMYNVPRKIQSKQLTDFLAKKGATAGNTSSVYYGSYVYFEKLRIKNGGKKSKKRQEVEIEQPEGMPRDARWNRGYIVPVGGKVYEDQFGNITSGW